MKTHRIIKSEVMAVAAARARYTTDRRQRMRTRTRRQWGVPIVALLVLLGLVGAMAIDVATPAFAADVTTIAGTGTAGPSGDGGPATAARLSSPSGMAVATDGTVYIADTDNHRVRRIGTDGIITTIAGNGSFGDDGDGGPATSASLSGLLSVALSPAGDILYIADIDNNRVRRVDLSTGVISNFAGVGWVGYGFEGDGGPATSASLASPEGVAVDAFGNVFIGDINNCVVRKVAVTTNIITTVAGIPPPSGATPSATAATAATRSPRSCRCLGAWPWMPPATCSFSTAARTTCVASTLPPTSSPRSRAAEPPRRASAMRRP